LYLVGDLFELKNPKFDIRLIAAYFEPFFLFKMFKNKFPIVNFLWSFPH